MKRPKPLAVVPEAPTVDDSLVLGLAAACMRARAEAVLIWARGDEADMFGARDMPIQSADDQVAEFRRELHSLAAHEPRTVRGAVAVLNVALDVLVQRMLKPELVLGEGPVVEIVRNVRAALENVDQDFPLVIGAGEPEAMT